MQLNCMISVGSHTPHELAESSLTLHQMVKVLFCTIELSVILYWEGEDVPQLCVALVYSRLFRLGPKNLREVPF